MTFEVLHKQSQGVTFVRTCVTATGLGVVGIFLASGSGGQSYAYAANALACRQK